jgi:hypothetical protein
VSADEREVKSSERKERIRYLGEGNGAGKRRQHCWDKVRSVFADEKEGKSGRRKERVRVAGGG